MIGIYSTEQNRLKQCEVDAVKSDPLKSNVFRTEPVIEPKKLPVHGSPVEPVVEQRSNR